ncbi:putative vacuolar protein sorting-associated protein VTA1 [Cryptotermes secundus]|uniref:Putative vacuolar protein sorting-associated protein VTA1 n=1 Tax=Cryptotermes secundus TaxID=105785 RepID=A0A2J7QQT5_9NEOP|nr:putative vacuolar protein sorting-associated protein VTA1 [Cryptotermes secundus]
MCCNKTIYYHRLERLPCRYKGIKKGRLYALQMGLKIDRKSDEAKALLTSLMNWLETQKRALLDNEAITHELAAQAHIENYALKLFVYADSQDRAGNFGKNVVKAFYTSGMLFDVLTTFGELSEELLQNRKYAKWKAAYIHNCLKNGETPVPGPLQEEDKLGDGSQNQEEDSDPMSSGLQGDYRGTAGTSGIGFVHPQNPPSGFDAPIPAASSMYAPPTTPSHTPSYPHGFSPYNPPATAAVPNDGGIHSVSSFGNEGSSLEGGVKLNPEQMNKAQKYCKWAGSALNYDDVPTAITNLQKALTLLQTGQDG